MSFGNVPADMLAGAVEKLLAKMDETDLAAFYERELSAMPPEIVRRICRSALRRVSRSRRVVGRCRRRRRYDHRRNRAARTAAALNALLAYARTQPRPAQGSDDALRGASVPISLQRFRAALRDASGRAC